MYILDNPKIFRVFAFEHISVLIQTLQTLQVMPQHLSLFLTYGDIDQTRIVFAANTTL